MSVYADRSNMFVHIMMLAALTRHDACKFMWRGYSPAQMLFDVRAGDPY